MAEPFEPRFVDLVRNYTTTEGTGNFVLGSAVTGYRSFSEALSDGEQFYYSAIGIEKPDEFEIGRGTLQADGTIAREPVSGTPTSFSAGNKTIALVAAAEWYEGVEAGSAAAFQAAGTREALAALEDTSKPAVLHENRREGLFLFDSTDRSGQVAIDPAQGVFIAPDTDTTGASGAWVRQYSGGVRPGWFGAAGDGATDDLAAIQASLNYLRDTGGGALELGSSTYGIDGTLGITGNDITIDARGATIVALDIWSFPMLWVGGDRARILGGTWKVLKAGSRQFDVDGRDCRIEGCFIQHDPEADQAQIFVRFGADGFEMVNCRQAGTNEAVMVEASNVLIMGNSFEGAPSFSGDDAIAIKAIQGIVENIRIIGNRFRHYADFVAIGSNVGLKGANDPDYTRRVRNVVIEGNVGENCSRILYVKPGAFTIHDYRDGIVEGVTFANNILYDLTGTQMVRPIEIIAGRGAIVRDIKGRLNRAVGRAATGSGGVYHGAFIRNFDLTGVTPGCNAPAINDVDIELILIDPYGAAAAGGSAPGTPFNSAAYVSNQTETHGTMKGITLDIEARGTWQSGIIVGPNLDDAVLVRRAKLSNINTSASSVHAGISTSSRLRTGEEISIGMAAGQPYQLSSPSARILGPSRVIGQSAVAISHTGTTAETTLASVAVPGAAMGPNGRIEIAAVWSCSGAAGTRRYRTYFGNVLVHERATGTASYSQLVSIQNRNSQSAQVGPSAFTGGGIGDNPNPIFTSAVDTSQPQTIDFRASLSSASDVITLESYSVRLVPEAA